MDYYIGLDIGTSSVKGVLLTAPGKITATAYAPFTYEKEGDKTELAPAVYLNACYSAVRALTEKAQDGKILGLCASAASGNLLLLDEAGEPLTNIISWQDQRGCSPEGLDTEAIYPLIGWGFDGKSFPLAQLSRIKKQQPQVLESCGKVCMSTEYLYYKLTGVWGISPSAGTPFYLIDQAKGVYDKSILELLGIPEEKLPPILPCGSVVGTVTVQGAKDSGLPEGTPILLGSFDHPSAARGVGVLEEGQMLLSCGTSWVALYPVTSREKILSAKMLSDPFLYPEGPYAGMTSVPSVSEKIRNCITVLLGDPAEPFQVLSSLAEKGASGVLKIDPTNPPEAEAVAKYSKEDVARAIMEGTVNLLKKQIDALADKGITAKTAVMVGGPSEDPMWVQLIEEACGLSVNVVHGAYAGAVGAAVIAGARR